MEKINIQQAESRSADLIQDNIEQLKQIFPEVIKEGKVDFEALHDLLGEYGDTAEERFCLNWAGKAEARREAQKRSTGTLRPCPEDSVDWDSTENLYIEGDNLEVLKLLQKGYHKKVKMIYIDPPYNTGKDFVYKDNYKDNLANYLEQTGQDKSVSTKALSDSDGRYHSNWLNMMYPRLKLARNLLTDDGVIFISIDDNEVDNLKKICSEIFGEENFIAQICHKSRASVSNDKIISPNHNHILFYARNERIVFSQKSRIGLNPILEGFDKEDENGKYKLVPVDGPGGAKKGNPHYEFEGIIGYWRFSQERMKRMYNEGLIVKTTNNLQQKYYLKDAQNSRRTTTTWWDEKLYTSTATAKLKGLMESGAFDTPKPIELLCKMLEMSDTKDAIILDFFSGSATTAHAAMQLNAEDGGNRKYIMVQLPEQTDEKSEAYKAGYKNICEIGKERIRRAGKKILEEQKSKAEKDGGLFSQNEESPKQDIGFKVFKLDSSNINSWDSSPENIEQALNNSLFNIKEDRTESDLLYEILIKYGIELSTKVNTHTIAGKTVYEMGAGSLIVCLADNLTTEVAEGIAKLWKEVKPEGDNIPCRVVFKDSGFDGSDEVKSNTLLILKQHGITNVASV